MKEYRLADTESKFADIICLLLAQCSSALHITMRKRIV